MKLVLKGVKSCNIPDLQLKVFRDVPFVVSEKNGISLLSQGGKFEKYKESQGEQSDGSAKKSRK